MTPVGNGIRLNLAAGLLCVHRRCLKMHQAKRLFPWWSLALAYA